MSQLPAMHARGPSAPQRRAAIPAGGAGLTTPEEIVTAKLSIPKISRQRGVTRKYDVGKFNFDDF